VSPDDAKKILGVGTGASAEEVVEAFRQKRQRLIGMHDASRIASESLSFERDQNRILTAFRVLVPDNMLPPDLIEALAAAKILHLSVDASADEIKRATRPERKRLMEAIANAESDSAREWHQRAFSKFSVAYGKLLRRAQSKKAYENDDDRIENEVAFVEHMVMAKKGLSAAETELGRHYLNGVGTEENIGEAIKWLLRAAQQNDSEAFCLLGLAYTRGGSTHDFAESIKWHRMGADRGVTRSMTELGLAYNAGQGVEADDLESMRWYRMAAEQGDAHAQTIVGDAYKFGGLLDQNYAEAVRWFRMAAEQGDADAQMELGEMYSKGLGVEQNDAEAKRWCDKANESRDGE